MLIAAPVAKVGHVRSQRLERDPTRAQQDRRRPRQVDHGGLHPDGRGAAVEHHVHVAAQVGQDVGRGGGAGTGGTVGARGHHRQARRADQRPGHRVRRHADGDRGAAGGDAGRHLRLPRQDQGQRAGPEGRGQLARQFGNVAGDSRQHLLVGEVDDQRVVRRAPLGAEDARDGVRSQGVGPQAVDRLGGERHQPAPPQHGGGGPDGVGVAGVVDGGLDGVAHGRPLPGPGR